MGFESKSAGTRATSSGTQFLAQQGSRIFNAISESVEDAYGEIGQMVVFQIVTQSFSKNFQSFTKKNMALSCCLTTIALIVFFTYIRP